MIGYRKVGIDPVSSAAQTVSVLDAEEMMNGEWESFKHPPSGSPHHGTLMRSLLRVLPAETTERG